MSSLPFTNLKEETDIAILAVLRACTLYVRYRYSVGLANEQDETGAGHTRIQGYRDQEGQVPSHRQAALYRSSNCS
jgi:hypothetical protein